MAFIKQNSLSSRSYYKFLIVVGVIAMIFGYAVLTVQSKQFSYIIVNLSNIHQNVRLTSEHVYFLNGVAYDFYSIDELLSNSKAGLQWKTFPLPNEPILSNIKPWIPHNRVQNQTISVQSTTGLAFVGRIYITSIPSLTDRQANLERMLTRYQIMNYEWRLKWTHETCNAPENKQEVHGKLNLRGKKPISSSMHRRKCSLTMKHVDIWHDIASRNSSLSLILEDDAVFVPNFLEKFNRTIHTAIRTGVLKMGGLTSCVTNRSHLSMNTNEWSEQDPVIIIGSCLQMQDRAFQKNRRDAPPMLSTHKSLATRCAHAYLLTACSAQALIRQIAVRKNLFLGADSFLDELIAASPTLQSFWLDPPIVYQGSRVIDLEKIPSFMRTTY